MNEVKFPKYQFRKKIALDLLTPYFSKMNNFLEVGAGRGDFSRSLLENKYLQCGEIVEFSSEASKQLKDIFFQTGNISVINEDFLLYSAPEKYSLVIMFEVLEHVKDDSAFINKVSDVLKSDGYFIFSVPARMKHWSAVDEIAGHYRRYEKKDLLNFLRTHNFEVLDCVSYGFPILNAVDYLSRGLFKLNASKIIKRSSNEGRSKQSGLGYLRYFWGGMVFKKIIDIFFSEKIVGFYERVAKMFNRYDLGVGYICLVKKHN